MYSMSARQVVLFHSAFGLRRGVHGFAEKLRAAGHTVHTPDLFDGETFEEVSEATKKRDAVGIPELIRRTQVAVAELPADLVYAGFSMGAASAAFLAATRPGARAAVLMNGAITPARWGGQGWPAVPVQVHFAAEDPWIEPAEGAALGKLVEAAGARFELHTYPGAAHLFADPDLPDYVEESAALMIERVLGFVGSV
jgi:dienelactone hydrolase